jgi:hypothetical protein
MKEKGVLLQVLFAIILMVILATLASADIIDPLNPYNYHSSYETSSIYLTNTTYNGSLIEDYSLNVLMCYEFATNFQGPSELNVSMIDSQNNCVWSSSYNQHKVCSSEGIFSGDYSIEGCNFLYRYPISKASSPYARFVIFVPILNKTFISEEQVLLKPVNTFSAELLQYGDIRINRLDNYTFTPPRDYDESSPWKILLLPLLTIIIECLAGFIFLKIAKTKERIYRILGFVLIANIISWPVALMLFSLTLLVIGLWAVVFAELFAVVFEAFFIYWTNKKFITLNKSFLLSIAINVTSFALGLLILISMM